MAFKELGTLFSSKDVILGDELLPLDTFDDFLISELVSLVLPLESTLHVVEFSLQTGLLFAHLNSEPLFKFPSIMIFSGRMLLIGGDNSLIKPLFKHLFALTGRFFETSLFFLKSEAQLLLFN